MLPSLGAHMPTSGIYHVCFSSTNVPRAATRLSSPSNLLYSPAPGTMTTDSTILRHACCTEGVKSQRFTTVKIFC